MISILLVEDNPLTRKLVRAAIANEAWTLLEATTGASALDIMTHQRPDLVLSDLALPDTNGFDLLKALREQPNASGVPILAFTGLLSHDEEGRALAVGFDGFIPKPVEPAHLRHVVRGHLPVPSTERRRFGAGKRLIVADDDATQLKLAKYRLGKVGFEVEAVSDGIEALNAARRRKPDVIVTDALMPRLDGFGVCLGVRQDETLADVPVVLLTSSYVEQEDRLLATRAGANAFVVRTADLAEVIGVLEKMMQTPGGAGASSSPTIARAEIDSVRSHRALQQLERQVSLNSGLMQRCSTLSAELSILTTVAEALVDMRDVEGALVEILANCLDVAGAARGAIYARELGGALTLKAQHGFGADLTLLDNALCDGKLLARAEASEELIAVEALGKGGLAVPLRGRGETFGLLVLDAPAGAPKEDWRPFAVAIASQVSLALALARSFADSARSEARTRALMAHANDAIFVSTPDGRVVEANRAAETLLRRAPADIVGRPFRELFTREDGAPPLAATTHLRELLARREDGALVPVQVSSNPVDAGDTRLVMAIARDVSEQRALETRLRQAQKMEAIGRLAGGVAHDFNNMLSVILSYSDLLLGDLKKDDPIAADLAEIKKAGERAADLTRQLLAFSRQQVLQSRVLGVNDVVVGMEKMAKRLIGEDIVLSLKLDPEAGNVRADLGQMNQVLMNLVVNARDAMPSGGKLSIETRRAHVAEGATADAEAGLAPGEYAVIRVADTGGGMDEATRTRIFEPFFTTKDAGRGTGLGLATVLGIVEQSGGKITVDTALGKGTTFQVHLRRVDDPAVRVSPSAPPPPAKVKGTETILVVEDEEQVRVLVRDLLRRSGYRVLEAANAGEALLVDEQHDGEIDLLVTDAVMPRMSGLQLVERMRGRRPAMKVVLMSGHTTVMAAEGGPPLVPLVQKPITPAVFARKIRAVLDGQPDD